MIIKEIHISGFGIFNGFSLTTLYKGVNILIGNNETGKSTLLKFLRFTLFGYPRFKDQRMPPLNGGNHGGRIKAILSSGKEVLFERSGDDSINLLYNGQEIQDKSQWSQLLGNASAELYNNVYAFSLEELVDLGSLNESGVEDKIFSVGLGLGNTSIGEVESSIQETADKIYTTKGRVQLIPTILKELESKKRKILKIQENLSKYQSLTQEIQQLICNVDELEKQVEKLRIEKNKLESYIICYDSFINIINADEALKKLPKLQECPTKGVEQLDQFEEKEKEFNYKIQEIKNGTKDEKGIDELVEAIKNILFNSVLLDKEDKVTYLRQNLEKYKTTKSDKEEEEQKIKDYEQQIKQGIANISGQWTEQNIITFTDLIVHKNKIEEFENEIEKIINDKRDSEAQLKAIQAKESPLNVKNIAAITSIIFLIGSFPAFYYGVHILGGVLLLISLILFFGKKYFLKEGSYNQIQNQINDLKSDEQKIKGKYENYLEKQLNLPKSLSVQATLDVFKSIDHLKKEINERDKLKDKVDKHRLPFIQKFEEKVSSLKYILKGRKQEENIEILVSQIIEEFDDSTTQLQKKNKLEEELNRKKKELENTESKLEQTQTNIKNLLESIGAKDRDNFRKKYEENNRVKDFIAKKESATETIEKIIGYNEADEVIEYLKTNEKATIESKVIELAGEIESKSQESKDSNNELGENRNEIKRIEGESELAEVLTELETERQKLQDAYKEWITGKVALKILTEVKSKYEKEKQPEVIKNSSNYFKRITRDRYRRIRVSLDDKEVAVYDSREASKKIGQLSRGTKEQLLISLRLGFIEEYEKQAEPLPLIVDEVMVNFDPERARQTAEIFQKFGENRQILIFTCHPTIINYFDSSSINPIQIKEDGQTKKIDVKNFTYSKQ